MPQRLAGGGVPDADGGVVAAGDREGAVAGEADLVDLADVADELERLRGAAGVEDARETVRRRDADARAVRREVDAVRARAVPDLLALGAAPVPHPDRAVLVA